jgi:hypothetical protein
VTIRKGEPWGEAVVVPTGLFVADDDAAAGQFVAGHRQAGSAPPPFCLAGGDLARTMGGGSPGRFSGTVTRAAVDLLRVDADGRTTWAVAHVVAARSWWRGAVCVAMNAQFIGRLDLAPRSHPNDGRLDALAVAPAMGLRARLQARRRARTGTHLPHPMITTSQVAAVSWTFAEPVTVRVDGRRWCTARSVTITVEPDALVVYA